jgi:hypothetical protein
MGTVSFRSENAGVLLFVRLVTMPGFVYVLCTGTGLFQAKPRGEEAVVLIVSLFL